MNIGTRWRSVVNVTHRPICPWEKRPLFPSIGGWVVHRDGLDVSGKKIFIAPAENRTIGDSSVVESTAKSLYT
jgi:hypothetical protein